LTNKDEKAKIYGLKENTKHLFEIKDNIIESINLDGEKHYCVYFKINMIFQNLIKNIS
jgi:hypothetical protein